VIAIVNNSTLFSDADAYLATLACSFQLRAHIAPNWKRPADTVTFFPNLKGVPAGARVLSLFDNADQAGDLGWHTESPTGQVYGKVFVEPVLTNGGFALTGALTVSSVLSHEVGELWADPTCALWADTTQNAAIAYELADPVESDSYSIAVGREPTTEIAVSNFVYPAWFDAQAPAGSRFDYLGNLKAPFSMNKGGYYVVMTEGTTSQQFGDEYPEWKLATKAHPAARTARRMKAGF
jgi:hypothetical protein